MPRLHLTSFAAMIAVGSFEVILHSNNFVQAQFFGWIMGLNHSLDRPSRIDWMGQYLAFLIWAAVTTLATFVLLKLLGRFPLVQAGFLLLSGIISVVCAPACFVAILHFQPGLFFNAQGLGWLWWEVTIALVAAVFFANLRWPVSTFTTLLLVVMHCLLWCRAYYITFGFRHPVSLLIPILTGTSLLTWGAWVRKRFLAETRIN